MPADTRPTTDTPRDGERCTRGRPAVVVYLTAEHGRVPYCGVPQTGGDGMDPTDRGDTLAVPVTYTARGDGGDPLSIPLIERGRGQ